MVFYVFNLNLLSRLYFISEIFKELTLGLLNLVIHSRHHSQSRSSWLIEVIVTSKSFSSSSTSLMRTTSSPLDIRVKKRSLSILLSWELSIRTYPLKRIHGIRGLHHIHLLRELVGIRKRKWLLKIHVLVHLHVAWTILFPLLRVLIRSLIEHLLLRHSSLSYGGT